MSSLSNGNGNGNHMHQSNLNNFVNLSEEDEQNKMEISNPATPFENSDKHMEQNNLSKQSHETISLNNRTKQSN